MLNAPPRFCTACSRSRKSRHPSRTRPPLRWPRGQLTYWELPLIGGIPKDIITRGSNAAGAMKCVNILMLKTYLCLLALSEWRYSSLFVLLSCRRQWPPPFGALGLRSPVPTSHCERHGCSDVFLFCLRGRRSFSRHLSRAASLPFPNCGSAFTLGVGRAWRRISLVATLPVVE